MGFFTPKHSWGNVTSKPNPAHMPAGVWVSRKTAKAHADKKNNPSKFKQGKQGKK